MKNILAAAAVALAAASAVTAATQSAPASQEPAAPVAATAPASDGLSELDAMTFGCPKAALNAAAREAAKAPSQGTYQFSYFNIINDAHHAAYEVRFKSNYEGEPELKYCVEIYCQQGWDPKTAKTAVTLMPNQRQRARAVAHRACGGHTPPPVKRPVK